MPLGAGYTAEEQITGKADHGGLKIVVHTHQSPLSITVVDSHRSSKPRRRPPVTPIQCLSMEPNRVLHGRFPTTASETRSGASCYRRFLRASV